MQKKEIINVKSESILAQYFKALLKNGITIGITEKMYNDFVDEFVSKVNTDDSEFARNIIIESYSFENIVKIVNTMNKPYFSSVEVIRLETIISSDNKKTLIAFPTYDLKEWNYELYKLGLFGRQQKIFEGIMKSKIESYFPTSNVKIISERLDVAKKVASFFINDLIERYVKFRISKGYWPSQCKDIDKYIFDRDIGKYIDESGTAETFKKLYLHAINVVSLLLEDKKTDTIKISNDPYNMLAHANFLKFIMPEKFSFLKQYIHNKYEERDAAITVTISQNKVEFTSSACVFSDPYGEWSNEYKNERGDIGNKSVEIMEKRIGIIS